MITKLAKMPAQFPFDSDQNSKFVLVSTFITMSGQWIVKCQRNSASNWRVLPPSCHRLKIFTLMPMQWPTSPNWVSPHIMRRTSLVTCNPSNLSFWSALDLLLFWWSQKIVRFRNHAASLAEHWHGSSAQQNWNYCTMSTPSTLWRVRWDQRHLITWLHVKKSR